MKRIVFLVKNYIGFGHIRRTLLIADQIRWIAPDVDIVFVSQAKSLLLLEESPYTVINFPFLYNLPSISAVETYRVLLQRVVDRLKPDLVIEDTYPDDWYLAIPSLENVPRVLILRRVEGLYLDELRENGLLDRYERVLVVHDQAEFLAETHVPETVLLMQLSQRFRFIGPVFRWASEAERAQVRAKYQMQARRTIVVNAGGGGEISSNAYCQNLFATMTTVAQRLLARDPSVHIVLITGPYYQGAALPPSPNLTIVAFEQHLAALLHEARVAVIRPGYNATHEALAGTASVIFVPNVSFKESLYTYADRMQRIFGVAIGDYRDPDLMERLVTAALDDRSVSPSRTAIRPSQGAVAAAIIEELESALRPGSRGGPPPYLRFWLCLGGVRHEWLPAVRRMLQEHLPAVTLVVADPAIYQPGDIPDLDGLGAGQQQVSGGAGLAGEQGKVVFLQSAAALDINPDYLRQRDVSVALYTNKSAFGAPAAEWCKRHRLRSHGIFDFALDHFTVLPGRRFQLPYRVASILARQHQANLYLDMSQLDDWASIAHWLGELRQWMEEAPYRAASFDQALAQTVADQLMIRGDL